MLIVSHNANSVERGFGRYNIRNDLICELNVGNLFSLAASDSRISGRKER
jgi:hypothetical protein